MLLAWTYARHASLELEMEGVSCLTIRLSIRLDYASVKNADVHLLSAPMLEVKTSELLHEVTVVALDAMDDG